MRKFCVAALAAISAASAAPAALAAVTIDFTIDPATAGSTG